MADNEVTITVNRPAEGVFGLVSDISNYSNWVKPNSPFFIESKVTSADPAVLGTIFENRLALGKMGKVVEFQPFERLVFEQKWYPESHAWVMRVEYHFFIDFDNCRITYFGKKANIGNPTNWSQI